MASVSIGRRRLPPDEIRWLATSGIMVTSEPVRDRMVALTRAISAATSSTSPSIDALEGLSKGTITATFVSRFAYSAISSDITIESAGFGGKAARQQHVVRTAGIKERQGAGIGSNQRHRAGFGNWRAARRRQYPSSGARPEHEHHRGVAWRVATPDSGP